MAASRRAGSPLPEMNVCCLAAVIHFLHPSSSRPPLSERMCSTPVWKQKNYELRDNYFASLRWNCLADSQQLKARRHFLIFLKSNGAVENDKQCNEAELQRDGLHGSLCGALMAPGFNQMPFLKNTQVQKTISPTRFRGTICTEPDGKPRETTQHSIKYTTQGVSETALPINSPVTSVRQSLSLYEYTVMYQLFSPNVCPPLFNFQHLILNTYSSPPSIRFRIL